LVKKHERWDPMMTVDNGTIGIVGSGIMGKQLAIFFALNKFRVVLISRNEHAAERTKRSLEQKLAKLGQQELIGLIHFSTDLDDLKDSFFIIEAVNENLETKKKILADIDSSVSKEAIIGTNTSSISIEELSKSVMERGRFLGTHFFNPVAKMRLVEVTKTSSTSDITVHKVQELLVKYDKYPIVIGDSPGFIVNRVLMPLINEASMLVQEGNDPLVVDKAIKLGLNHPMGPLELADLIGIDICVRIMENISSQKKDVRYLPSGILKDMMVRGELGRKSGKGFFLYPKEQDAPKQ
jgi:3-hydroxybutyryl-CoA dehydrogenase